MFLSLFGGDIPRGEQRALRPLEKRIGYRFRKPSLLKRALTHKSYVHESRLSSLEQNERTEFLGDAVLELAISTLLMDFFPGSSEGDLSKLRASVVNEMSLAELARGIDLGKYLHLGRGEDQGRGREKNSLLSDAYEAVLGAIFLDSGFESAFRVIKHQFAVLLETATEKDINQDYKTRLQEESQNLFQEIPRYELVREIGPDHAKTFEVQIFIRDQQYGKGLGRSKKQAEQGAAMETLRLLGKS